MDDMKQHTQQDPLPFDDGADEPVSFTLTARAKRAVAPHALPALSVVPAARLDAAPGGRGPLSGGQAGAAEAFVPPIEDPADTRPSRARALRRAGRSSEAIATQLGVDELLVRAWIGSVGPQGTPAARQGWPSGPRSPAPTGRQAMEDDDRAPVLDHERTTAFELARAAACEQARAGRLADPGFAAGLGLIAGIVEVDRNSATITTRDQDVAVAAVRWLGEQLPMEPSRLRVVLRVGAQAAGDLAAFRWATAMGVPRDRVAAARWRDAPDPHAVEALVRLADPTVAATVAGWRDALLDPVGPDPADVAF